MNAADTRIANLAFAALDAFPGAQITLERAHHVTWMLITLGKARVAVRWNGDRRLSSYEICTPEGYRRCGYMQTTAHASSIRDAVADLKLYARRGFDALFKHELDRRMAESEAHPERSSTLAQMKRRIFSKIRQPYVDTTPPSLKSVVEMTPYQLRKLRASF